MEVIHDILPWLYGLVAVILIWLMIEIAIVVRHSRKAIDDMKKSVDDVMVDVKQMSTDLAPAIKKIDPMVEKVTLTVDAANLEIMRLDEIMADVAVITDKGAKAANSIDSVTSAPMDLVGSVANKVKRRFGPKSASKVSMRISDEKTNKDASEVTKLVDAVDSAIK